MAQTSPLKRGFTTRNRGPFCQEELRSLSSSLSDFVSQQHKSYEQMSSH